MPTQTARATADTNASPGVDCGATDLEDLNDEDNKKMKVKNAQKIWLYPEVIRRDISLYSIKNQFQTRIRE